MPYKNSDRFPGQLVQLVEHAKLPQGRGHGPWFESATARYNNLTYQRIMKERIVVEYSAVGKIAGLLGCSREMVSHSLAFRKNSKLARSIRKLAIERGGTKVGGNPEKKESDEK